VGHPIDEVDMRDLDVFISYDPDDEALARQVQGRLRAGGLTCWSEAVDLIPGQLWDEEIPAQIRKAAAMVFLVTARWPSGGAKNTHWYGPEKIAFAISLGERGQTGPRMVPVLIDGGTPDHVPFGLTRAARQRARAADNSDVIFDLHRLLGRTPPKTADDLSALMQDIVIETTSAGAG